MLAVVLSLGVLGLLGVPLNPANMIAFPLILGVGVDNGVHVLHDYLLRRRGQEATISYAIGRGVLVKALTTMIGFGTLMISSERGLVGTGSDPHARRRLLDADRAGLPAGGAASAGAAPAGDSAADGDAGGIAARRLTHKRLPPSLKRKRSNSNFAYASGSDLIP